MFLIRFFRYISGYVIFSGSGGFTERFINLCSMNRISLWDIKSSSGFLEARTSINGYRKLRQCAKKSGIKIRITKKCGLPFILAPYYKRKGLFAGALLSAVITVLLSSTVWTTEVLGNERFTKEQIIEIAEHYGVYPGAFRHNLDLKNIRSSIKAEVDGISWFSVVIDGSHVLLHISETDGSTEIIDNSEPCNIVSGIDGEVLKIETQQGTAAVLPGNAVTKGDLLISGVSERSDGSVYFTHARGSAIIRTEYTDKIILPYNIDIIVPSETTNCISLNIFGLKIPLYSEQYGTCIRQDSRFISYKNKALPLGSTKSRYVQYKTVKTTLPLRQAALMISFLSFLNEKEIMIDAIPESKSVNININESYIQVKTHHIVHKKTGIENYFEVSD